MTSMTFSPDTPKTAEELQLEATIRDLADRLESARDGSATHTMIQRQLDGVRRGSELGSVLMEEYDLGMSRHW
jgi:hypothetical protein